MNELQTKGQGLQGLRNNNLQMLLTTIWKNAPVYRDELAKMTGLAPSSVTRLINELIRLELVEEINKKEIKRGRSPQLLTPNRNAGYVISLDLSGDSLRAGIFDSANNAEWATKLDFEDFDSNPIGDQIIRTIRDLTDHPGVEGRDLLGIGVSVPGIVNIHDGIIVDSFNLNMHDYPIREILSSEFNKVVYIEHDASAAAAAEQYYGAGKEENNFIYIMLSNGIGSGVILNDNIYRGQTGRLGQLGHIVVNPNGQSCVCGQFGCLETVVSVPAILTNARRALAQWNKTYLDEMIGNDPEQLNISILADAARQGNKLALRIFNKAAEHVAYAISIYVTLFDIHLVILGGELMKAGDLFLDMIRETLDRYLTTHKDIRVIGNQLEENAFLRGVSLLTIQELLRFT